MTPSYVRYTRAVESPADGEQAVIDKIIATMQAEGRITQKRYGKAVRTSHAKSHALVEGELKVLEGLPPELRQGLFAEPRNYPAYEVIGGERRRENGKPLAEPRTLADASP